MICPLTNNALCNESIVHRSYFINQLPYEQESECATKSSAAKKVLDKTSLVTDVSGSLGAVFTAITLNPKSKQFISDETTIGDALKRAEPFCASYDFLKNPSIKNLTSNEFEFAQIFDENGHKIGSLIAPHSTEYLVNLYSGLVTIFSLSLAAVSKLISYFIS